MTKKQNSIIVSGQQINVVTGDGYKNYICLTDLINANDADVERTGMILQNWMRRKDTIEYTGLWETISNKDFNVLEFEYIRNEAGTNRFVMTAKEWTKRTRSRNTRVCSHHLSTSHLPWPLRQRQSRKLCFELELGGEFWEMISII